MEEYSRNLLFSLHSSIDYRKNRHELKPYDLICNRK